MDEGKVEMEALDGRRKELEAQLKTVDEPPALLHPEMARIYRTKVTELAEALQQPESRLEAAEALRGPRGRYRADSKREQGGTRHRALGQPRGRAGGDRTNEEVAGIRRPLLASIFAGARNPLNSGILLDRRLGERTNAQAEAASDSSRFRVSGYLRTSQIKAAACSFGLLRPCSHRSSVLGFTPILNANTWRDMLSASRVSRTMSASIGGTVIGWTSLDFRVSRPSRSSRIASTPDISSRKRLRFFRVTGRFFAAIVHFLRVRRRAARRASSASRAAFNSRFSAALRSATSQVVDGHEPDLGIGQEVVVNHPEAPALALAATPIGPISVSESHRSLA